MFIVDLLDKHSVLITKSFDQHLLDITRFSTDIFPSLPKLLSACAYANVTLNTERTEMAIKDFHYLEHMVDGLHRFIHRKRATNYSGSYQRFAAKYVSMTAKLTEILEI